MNVLLLILLGPPSQVINTSTQPITTSIILIAYKILSIPVMKKKSQLSSFDILVLSKELNDMLVGGFIDKVYQVEKNEVIIRTTVPISQSSNNNIIIENSTSTQASKYQQINLVIKLGKYIYAEYKNKSLARSERSNKTPPGAFAMLLRKHLRNGKIADIYQHEFDRIIVIEILKRESYQLIIELFGDGNAILVKAGKIVQPLFSRTWSYRTIRSGKEFKFPPARINPIKVEKNEFFELLKSSGKDLVRTLIMDLDIPGKFAEEICLRVGLDKNIKSVQISEEDLEKLFNCLSTIIEDIETDPDALLIYEDEARTELIELTPIRLVMLKEHYAKTLDNYNLAVEEFFNPKPIVRRQAGQTGQEKQTKTKTHKDLSSKTVDEQARIQRQLVQQKVAIEKFSKDIKLNHQFGEAIYTNYLRCEEILKEVLDLRDKVSPDEIFEALSNKDDIKELNPHEGYVILTINNGKKEDEFGIKLDVRKNVIENANYYYELSKHAKEKLHGAQNALERTESLLNDLTVKLKHIEETETRIPKRKIVKHFWFEKYHWFLTNKGNIVIGGRDAKSNDQVVKRYLEDNDRYCHADVSGAASVILKHNPEEDELSKESLQEACEFAVIYSKAWNAKVGSGTAYWVKPDQVSKSPQSGEFLPRGAFVIRGKRNHITKIKLELAIGEIEYEGHFKLMAGPKTAVSVHAKTYLLLAPGDKKKNVMANELSELFNVAVDDILTLLPSGQFSIVKKLGLKGE